VQGKTDDETTAKSCYFKASAQGTAKAQTRQQKVEIQQALVGLQSLCKASTGQPKVNTIQTKIYRKSSVQGFARNLTKARQKRKQESKKWQYNKQLSGCENQP
jgi:hypothetical protein